MATRSGRSSVNARQAVAMALIGERGYVPIQRQNLEVKTALCMVWTLMSKVVI